MSDNRWFEMITDVNIEDAWTYLDPRSVHRVRERNGSCTKCSSPLTRAKQWGKKNIVICMTCKKVRG